MRQLLEKGKILESVNPGIPENTPNNKSQIKRKNDIEEMFIPAFFQSRVMPFLSCHSRHDDQAFRTTCMPRQMLCSRCFLFTSHGGARSKDLAMYSSRTKYYVHQMPKRSEGLSANQLRN
eukprot:1176388-Amphidinium_carterae.1